MVLATHKNSIYSLPLMDTYEADSLGAISLLRRHSFGSSRKKDCVTSQKNVCVGG